MPKIRKVIAAKMHESWTTCPRVTNFDEADVTELEKIRVSSKDDYAKKGIKLTSLPFIVKAVSSALRSHPTINASLDPEQGQIIYKEYVNIGIAVDLDPGLIVPVIRNADELTLVGLAKRIIDLATRARDRKLKPDEIQGVTFSITNPGVLGTLVGMPIIPEGTAAILGTGAIEKRPIVIDVDGTDAIAIRLRSLFSLGYDHRIVDGADAARFLARLKEILEAFPEDVA